MDYFITYMGANVICLIIFNIMLVHDLRSMDRQEKQIKYDRSLIAFMLYFISDSVWAAVQSGVLPKNAVSVSATTFLNYIIMAVITYSWLRYVMAEEQVLNRDSSRTRFALLFPFTIVTAVLVLLYIIRPASLISDELELLPAVNIFQAAVPCIYIAAVLFYSIRRALREENPLEKKQHLFVGVFPLLVVAGGLIEMLFGNDKPLFCFCCTILMLVFYIRAMEDRISADPLTGLNNRGQLIRYMSQKGNIRREGRRTFVIMFDLNNFKRINDTCGHAEGDRALVIAADALMKAVKSRSMPLFLGRYGGDEFVMIAHPEDEPEIPELIGEVRERIEARCRGEQVPYTLTVSAGYDELRVEESLQQCLQRADEKMYREKKEKKSLVL